MNVHEKKEVDYREEEKVYGIWKVNKRDSGGDALRGNTRTHPEHEG